MMTKEKKNTKTAPKSSSSKTKPAVKTSVAKASAPVKVVAKAAAAPVKKAAAKPAKVKKVLTGNTIKIKQIGSGAGRIKPQIQTLKGLGLNKMNRTVELQDTPSIRGMINKVKHLIKVFSK
jgi:large subunit ribosomal protein L30